MVYSQKEGISAINEDLRMIEMKFHQLVIERSSDFGISKALPKDKEEYLLYMKNVIEFVKSRKKELN